MTVNIQLVPVVSIVAGIVILLVPRILNYVVAIYLITIGAVGLTTLH